MNKDAVQHERGPRNSTIRRQVALYLKESGAGLAMPVPPPPPTHHFLQAGAINPLLPPFVPPTGPLGLSYAARAGPSTPFRPVAVCQPTPKVRAICRTSRSPISQLSGYIFRAQTNYMHDMGLPTSLSTPNAVCEAAAQILLLNVKWLKSLDVFVSLPARDQVRRDRPGSD